MSQSAMSAVWDRQWEPLSDIKLDEWFHLKDELSNKEINESSTKPSKYEIAEQVLHDIEDLERNYTDYWLDDLPLLDEIQTLKLTQELEEGSKQEIENLDFVLDEQRLSPNDGSVTSDVHKVSDQQDLLTVSYENATTFVLSDENILYINDEPFVGFTSLQQDRTQSLEYIEKKTECKDSEKEKGEKEDANFRHESSWDGNITANVKKETAEVDEILKSTALELDPWESDTSRSEMSSDGMASAYSSPKETQKKTQEMQEETDDPDWKPMSVLNGGRKYARKSKLYWRGGSQEEKKLRKKEQNKNAATRYRQKKKAEVYEILKEEKLLKEKKAKLEEKLADIQSEIKYLKPLMRELFRAKGIIN